MTEIVCPLVSICCVEFLPSDQNYTVTVVALDWIKYHYSDKYVTKQNKTKQKETNKKQNQTKQNKTKQNKTKAKLFYSFQLFSVWKKQLFDEIIIDKIMIDSKADEFLQDHTTVLL